VRHALTDISAQFAAVGEVHDVRVVRESDEGEIVNSHCLVDPLLSVAEVHERVDDVERALRERFPSIKRVIGHAEPTAQLELIAPQDSCVYEIFI
jgi:divalent metal cation (Fe/Co/Zn/Cd) transporter